MKKFKVFNSFDYNYIFNTQSGHFIRWGVTEHNDPEFSKVGPEIADIEVTTRCNMLPLCSYCYKSNTANGKNMSLSTFQEIIKKINANNQLTQVAFGLGATAEENPELWAMCDWLRTQDVVPNGTVADITEETAKKIANTFGSCAVSYHNKDKCYDSIKRLTDCGMKQVNMHFVLHESSVNELEHVLYDIHNDPRLSKLNAIVLLSLKQKGRASGDRFRPVSQKTFNRIVQNFIVSDISFGMDSCSSHKYMKFLETTDVLTNEQKDKHYQMVEPCESGLFSVYFDVEGTMFPCSFAEGVIEGKKLDSYTDFIHEVWNSSEWRQRLIKNNRQCLLYNI